MNSGVFLRFRGIFWVWVFVFLICAFPVSAQNEDFERVVRGNNEFAFDLYRVLSRPGENLFFSPYSISTALAMTYGGARGETARAMERTLRFPLTGERLHQAFGRLITSMNTRTGDDYQLHTANRIWVARGRSLNPVFLRVIERYYNAGAQQLDFAGQAEAARRAINEWVEVATNRRIRDLIPPGLLGPGTEFVLTNAIYFMGNWEFQFPEGGTREAPFSVSATEQIQVPLMFQENTFSYLEADGFRMIALPYKREALTMVVILPDEIGMLSAIEERLNADALNEWMGRMTARRVRVYLPRFTMTSDFSLGEVLGGMNMAIAFASGADFSGIAPGIFLSEVVHKAFVEVNERGTEAAAATGVIGVTSAGEEPPVFRADRPFIFMIRDTVTGSILFLGKVNRP